MRVGDLRRFDAEPGLFTNFTRKTFVQRFIVVEPTAGRVPVGPEVLLLLDQQQVPGIAEDQPFAVHNNSVKRFGHSRILSFLTVGTFRQPPGATDILGGMPVESFFHAGQVALNVARWPGDPSLQQPGPTPVLFLHGITDKHQAWHVVADPIRQGATALALDFRGHGRSGRVPGEYLFTDYPHDIIALLEAEPAPSFRIVGHSLGAAIGLQIAAARPDLVSALVLEDPPIYAAEIHAQTPDRFDRFQLNSRLQSRRLPLREIEQTLATVMPDAGVDRIRDVAYALFVTDPGAIPGSFRQFSDFAEQWQEHIETSMRSVQCPVLMLQGNFELGGWTRAEDADRINSLIPDCTVEYWDDWGHGLHHNDPDRFVDQVNKFLESW